MKKYVIALTDYSKRYIGVGLEGLFLTNKYPHEFETKEMAQKALETAKQIFTFTDFEIQEL